MVGWRSKPHLIALALVVWRDSQSRLFPHFADHTCGAALAGLRCAPGNHPVPASRRHSSALSPQNTTARAQPILSGTIYLGSLCGRGPRHHQRARRGASRQPATPQSRGSQRRPGDATPNLLARPTECGVVRILIGDDHVRAPHADNLVDEKP